MGSFLQFFENKSFRVLTQVLFWGCLLGAVNLLFMNVNVPKIFTYRSWLLTVSVIFLILWNVYFLVPRFFSQQRYGAFTLSVLLSILVMLIVVSLVERSLPMELPAGFKPDGPQRSPPDFSRPRLLFNPRYLFNLISYTAAIMASTVFESVQIHRLQELAAGQIQRGKLEAEMKFLKSQINPHFLFNVLNNVYTLSLIKSESTPEIVMKLSEMLRYMLYKITQDRVLLTHEIKYIENYVALQQLKDETPLAVRLNIEVEDEQANIAPMILIPFVENAFKHSKIEDTQKGWIEISIVEKRGKLLFQVSNSVVKLDYTKDPTGGIGLQNVQRRLELEYPQQHQLKIEKRREDFSVELSISLI